MIQRVEQMMIGLDSKAGRPPDEGRNYTPVAGGVKAPSRHLTVIILSDIEGSMPESFISQIVDLYAPGSLIRASGRLEEKPGPILGLVEPHFDQACRGDIPMSVAQLVCVAKPRGKAGIVIHQLDEHIERPYELGIVVLDTLESRNVSNRMQRRGANLPKALGDLVRHRE